MARDAALGDEAPTRANRDFRLYAPDWGAPRITPKGVCVMVEPETRTRGVDTMSGSDALLWTISADPVMRPTIVALMTLDGTPEWTRVRALVAGLTHAVPRLRSRVAARALGRPQFVVDPSFDLDTHLRRMRLPGTGGFRDVLDLAQTMATSGFDAALPLWEAVLVEGVGAAGDSVLVMKVHHALIDGVGGLAVLARMFDPPAAPPAAPRDARMDHPGPQRRQRCALPGLHDARRLLGGALDAASHPLRTMGRAAEVGTSVARLMAPAARPVSPLMTGRGFRRRVEVLDLELNLLARAAADWGGTVNDVFVASVVRGLTRYHAQHGTMTPGLRALMPVNVRKDEDPTGGNRFVPARFVVPTHADVVDCMDDVRRRAEQWKHAPGLEVSEVLATGLSALPPPVARGLWSSLLLGDDFCITNIAGPPPGARLAGVPVRGIYAISPPSGAAFNISLVSVGERACVALNVDVAAVPDSPKLAACIEDGFAEVCTARPGA